MELITIAKNSLNTATKYKSNHLTFITRRSTIIAVGRNYEDTTHPLANRFGYIDCRVHSELAAIIRFLRSNKRLRDCKVWNIRIDREGTARLSRPCNRCKQMLSYFGARRVYYTTEYGTFEQLI